MTQICAKKIRETLEDKIRQEFRKNSKKASWAQMNDLENENKNFA